MKEYQKKDVVVVVPMYRPEWDLFEEISLDMLFRHLKDYTVSIVIPEELQEEFLGLANREYTIERFDTHYFKNTYSYSELCLSEEFYVRFQKFQYMLLYQLDALVFSDRLLDFCNLGYDYIGAPLDDSIWSEFHVGNGGLSLRKIDSTLKLVQKKESILSTCSDRRLFERQEDCFFAYCGSKDDIDYIVPDPYQATTFSAQSDAYEGMTVIAQRGLPFGTHHWPDWNYSFWKPYVENYGYKLPTEDNVSFEDYYTQEYFRKKSASLLEYLETCDDSEKDSIADKLSLDRKQKYVLRGMGIKCREILGIFKKIGIEVSCIVDRKPNDDLLEGIPVIATGEYVHSGEPIIIATKDFEKEIEKELTEIGLKKDRDFYCYSTVFIEKWSQLVEEFDET